MGGRKNGKEGEVWDSASPFSSKGWDGGKNHTVHDLRGSQCGHGKVTKAGLCKCWRGRSTKCHVGAQEERPTPSERREVCFLEEEALEP